MRVPLSKVKENPDNPRSIKDDSFKKLVNSLRDFPEMAEVREIVVNKDYVILGGNMRFRAMKEAGWKDVPVKVVDWPEEKQREFIIKDNVSGGDWDWDELANSWDLDELDKWGLEVPDFGTEEEVVEDEAPEVSDEPPVSKLGEIYQLGRHRVMCGDSTDKANVELLMDGTKADMVFTDPPYGMDLETDYSKRDASNTTLSGMKSMKDKGTYNAFNKLQRGKYTKVIGDDKDYNPSHIFEMFDYCKEIFLWGADYYAELIPDRKKGSWIIWDKRVGIEHVSFTLSEFETCWSKNKHARTIARFQWFGVMGLSKEDTKSRVHPTQKPVELCAWFTNQWSKAGDKIVDLFLGSGSTLIACEQTERTCYGMEISEQYVDVIRKRYWKFTHDNDEEGWEEGTLPV